MNGPAQWATGSALANTARLYGHFVGLPLPADFGLAAERIGLSVEGLEETAALGLHIKYLDGDKIADLRTALDDLAGGLINVLGWAEQDVEDLTLVNI